MILDGAKELKSFKNYELIDIQYNQRKNTGTTC